MGFTLPVHVSCVSSSIGIKETLGTAGAPALSLGLSLDIPIQELLAAMLEYQQRSPPRADELPDTLPKFALKPPTNVDPAQAQERPGFNEAAKPTTASFAGSPWETMPTYRPRLNTVVHRVKVYNLMKSVKSRDVQYIFEKHVGPIEKCVLTDCVAAIQFTMPDHARTAVERYDGGILEISTDKKRSDDTLISLAASPWAHDGLALRSKLEETLWPLSDCQLRRGDGWLTMFRVSTAKEARKSDQGESHQVDFKGSIITVTLDTDQGLEQEGIVINGSPMDL